MEKAKNHVQLISPKTQTQEFFYEAHTCLLPPRNLHSLEHHISPHRGHFGKSNPTVPHAEHSAVVRNLEARSTLASIWFIPEDDLLAKPGMSVDGLFDSSLGDSLSSKMVGGKLGVCGPSDEVAEPAIEQVDGVRLIVGTLPLSWISSGCGPGTCLVSRSQRNGMRRRFDLARTARNDCWAGDVTAKEPSTSASLRIPAGTEVDLDDVVDDVENVDMKEEIDLTEEQVSRLRRVGLYETCSTAAGVSGRVVRSTLRTCSDISPVRFLHNFRARSTCGMELEGYEVIARISER